MPIRACPECSSDRLEFPPRGETAFHCVDCGWNGQPVEFPNWTAWQQAKGSKRLVA